jgi:CRISPR/Cas system-associated protein endoribonuclease Cas2
MKDANRFRKALIDDGFTFFSFLCMYGIAQVEKMQKFISKE